jgi:hypothetical protein
MLLCRLYMAKTSLWLNKRTKELYFDSHITGWRGLTPGAVIRKRMESTIQGARRRKRWSILGLPACVVKKPATTTQPLMCGDFGWTATWRILASSMVHGGRASLEFLKAHPRRETQSMWSPDAESGSRCQKQNGYVMLGASLGRIAL